MDAKLKYKSKKIKIVFFDIDDTLRVKATGYIPESIKLTLASLVVMRQRFRREHRLLMKPLILFILIYLFSRIFIKITTFIKCGHLKILEIACNCPKS